MSNIIGNQENYLFRRSFTLKLTEVGFNKLVTIPQSLDIYKGELFLKSYAVQFQSNANGYKGNTTVPEINLKMTGITHLESENNRSDILTLPISMNELRTTLVADWNLILEVGQQKIHRNIYYDLLGENMSDTITDFKCAYLTFEYFSAVL